MATDSQSTAMDQATPTSTTADANTWLFVVVVAIAGAMVLMRAAAIALTAPLNGYVIVLGVLTIVAGRFCIKIPGRSATVSFSDFFVFTSLVLVGPAPATLTVAIDGLWVSVKQRDRRAHRTLFNVVEPALSTWAAGQVFFFVVSHVSTLRDTPDLMGRVAGTIAMAATYFVLNSVLTASAVAIESRPHWRHSSSATAQAST